MAILGIPNTRISDQFARQRLLSQVQSDQIDLLRLETQLSTGRKFELPSEDPVASLRVIGLQRLLEQKAQAKSNLATNQSYLNATDSALSQVSNLMADVRGEALAVIGTTASDTQRQAVAGQVLQAVRQLVEAGNQQFRGRYLFAGSQTAVRPFETLDANLVGYQGNENRLASLANANLLFDTNLQGNEVFGATSEAVRGTADLRPVLTLDTRLADLRYGKGINRGSIAVSDGQSTRVVDLSKAETVGDVARLIRASPPAGNAIDVEIGARGLILQAGNGDLTVAEIGGTTAAELGILTETGSGGTTVVGADLDPALRPTTRLADVLGSRARAVLRPSGDDNDIVIQADHNGEDLNDVTILLVDDGSVTPGQETAVYDAIAKTLTLAIDDGHTQARHVVDAINNAHQQDPAAMPFTAALDPLDDRLGGAGVISIATTPPVSTHDGSGADFDQADGLQIVSGPFSGTIDLSAAVTIEDLVNTLNTSGLGVLAEINRAATGIDVRTRLSGADFAIGENGGTAAAQLGIRTFNADTPLADLNFGRGVTGASGETSGGTGEADFAITRNDGVTFEIDVHDAQSIGDVIDLINNNPVNQDPQQGVPLVARLAAFGNGIELVDNSAGTSRLTVTRINSSGAAVDLGLVPAGQDSRSSSTSGAQPDLLTGADVNPRETVGLFTALLRLQDGLAGNNSWEIERAMAMLDQTTTNMNFARAELGARQQGLELLQTRLENEDVQIQTDLSRDYDVDLAELMSKLLAKQVSLQASLQTIAQTSRMTLLDYL